MLIKPDFLAMAKFGDRRLLSATQNRISIDRLKLNDHDALPQERRRVWQKVSNEIDGYLEAKSKYRPGINQAPQETMEERLRRIKELTRPDAELSAVALWCIRFRNDPRLLRLVS